MKFKDMYVGQKVRVRDWGDMMSDPDLVLINGGQAIISTSPYELGIFFSNDKSWCGTVATVCSLRDMTDGNNRTGYVFIDKTDGIVSRVWTDWMFEPVEYKVDSDVFLSCLML